MVKVKIIRNILKYTIGLPFLLLCTIIAVIMWTGGLCIVSILYIFGAEKFYYEDFIMDIKMFLNIVWEPVKN